jgi:hypothetical protein
MRQLLWPDDLSYRGSEEAAYVARVPAGHGNYRLILKLSCEGSDVVEDLVLL